MKGKNEQEDSTIRLDKWLWAARFYKTRAIARDMVDGGKVHYNGQRGKPSKAVEIGAEIKLSSPRSRHSDAAPQMLSSFMKKQRPALKTAKRLHSHAR